MYCTNSNCSLKKTEFILFVNDRLVEDASLKKALEAAYTPANPRYRFAAECFNAGFTFEALLIAADAHKRAGTTEGEALTNTFALASVSVKVCQALVSTPPLAVPPLSTARRPTVTTPEAVGSGVNSSVPLASTTG